MKIKVVSPFVYGDRFYKKGEIAEIPASAFSADRMEKVAEPAPTKKKVSGNAGKNKD